MQIYIGNKKYDFTYEQLCYMYLDEGSEATIYRLGNKVLKIYRNNPSKVVLGYETASLLSKIATNNYLLPEKPIYDENKNFDGYTTTYKDKYPISLIAKMPLDKFLKELKSLAEDTDILTEHDIEIYDLTYENTIYDGHLHICDPGSFLKLYGEAVNNLSEKNRSKLNLYLYKEILANCLVLSKKKKEKIANMAESYNAIEEIEKDTSKTVGAFVKKIAR